MLSMLTVQTPKPLFLSTPFLPNHHHLSPPANSPPKQTKALSISALIIPPSSSYTTQKQKQQQLYQPFRPPPSPVPAKYRSLDTNGRLEILTDRLGLWYEYAPLITALLQEGFISPTLEEITGITSREQNRLVVASQVRDSLVESTDDETVSYFDPPGSPELLYAIRILNTQQRAAAARFIIANGFDGKEAEELARAMKDFPRRYGDRGYECFNGNLPGDCLAFMYLRQALEHKSESSEELCKAALEKGLEVVETERARQRLLQELEGKDGDASGEGALGVDVPITVPVVRMAVGEVAESSVVVVLPVCRAEGKEAELEEAPWETAMGGQFGVVETEKGWSRWVVLPGWSPLVELKKGGVVVAFPRARGVLSWKAKRKDLEEEILVVADRGRKEVEFDDGFYLVLREKGNGEEALKVENGSMLKERGVKESLGTVVLVVRPPRDDEIYDQLSDDDWE